MLALERKKILALNLSLAVVVLLSPVADSSQYSIRAVEANRTDRQTSLKLTPALSLQIKLHALLLWASVGFLMPLGILVIRMSNRVVCGRKLKLLFYSHVSLQTVGVLLATTGAVLSMRNFGNTFNNTHQRMGLALYALIWIQPLIGIFRPYRGVKVRSIWYFAHWLLGTGITVVGIANIFIGLHAYHERTSKSVRLWIILFSMEITIMAFIYLLQDRWDYLQKQGVILGDEQIRPAAISKRISTSSTDHKESVVLP